MRFKVSCSILKEVFYFLYYILGLDVLRINGVNGCSHLVTHSGVDQRKQPLLALAGDELS